MAGRLESRAAVITGGASGIGRAAVLQFLAEGARVVVADLNELTGKETLELAGQAGHAAAVRFVRTDVSQEADVEAAVQLCVREFGRLDCIFNNAGLGGAFGSITDMAVEDWDYTFSVLARGVFLGIKHAARVMKTQGQGGAIVNTASVAGLGGGAGPLAYSSAKGAVVNLTRAAARELAADLIRVNAICPGAILTPLLHRGNAEAVGAALAQIQPWPEAGQPEHVASAALFLASEESRFITGETLVVDGGLMAASPTIRLGAEATRRVAGLRGVDHGTTGRPPEVRFS